MIGPTSLHVRSINHKAAPTEIREKAHLEPDAAISLMEALCGNGNSNETGCVSVMPVSTCNRTEIYLEMAEGKDPDAALRRGMAAIGGDPELFFTEFAVGLDHREAIAHLFRVSAGMESMMLGEPQISAQLKDAYRLARGHQEPGPGMLRAFQGAFRAGKRVRTETRIGSGAVSVAFAAVELARKFFARLSDQKAVLVGAGETGSLAARHFLQHDIGQLVVVNRSFEKARDLALALSAEAHAQIPTEGDCPDDQQGVQLDDDEAGRGRITARVWDDLVDAISEADVILSTTGATEPVILPDMIERAIAKRRGKPLFMLDIAVPRDIHPEVKSISNVFVFGLDDLDEIIAGNLSARESQVPHALRIIDEELDEFQKWLDDVDLRPTVAEFRAYLEELKDKQVGFVRKKQSDEIAAAVDRSLQQFIKKVLGRSVSTLKASQTREERERDLDTLRRIFSVDDSD